MQRSVANYYLTSFEEAQRLYVTSPLRNLRSDAEMFSGLTGCNDNFFGSIKLPCRVLFWRSSLDKSEWALNSAAVQNPVRTVHQRIAGPPGRSPSMMSGFGQSFLIKKVAN